MPNDILNYHVLMQQALQGIVKRALQQIVRHDAMPSQHKIYIDFLTTHPHTEIDADLRTQHPEAMRIILEHQYWDLAVKEDGFSIGLRFSGILKTLYVPFDAVFHFNDPNAEFSLDIPLLPLSTQEEKTKQENVPITKPTQTSENKNNSTIISLDKFRQT